MSGATRANAFIKGLCRRVGRDHGRNGIVIENEHPRAPQRATVFLEPLASSVARPCVVADGRQYAGE